MTINDFLLAFWSRDDHPGRRGYSPAIHRLSQRQKRKRARHGRR